MFPARTEIHPSLQPASLSNPLLPSLAQRIPASVPRPLYGVTDASGIPTAAAARAPRQFAPYHQSSSPESDPPGEPSNSAPPVAQAAKDTLSKAPAQSAAPKEKPRAYIACQTWCVSPAFVQSFLLRAFISPQSSSLSSLPLSLLVALAKCAATGASQSAPTAKNATLPASSTSCRAGVAPIRCLELVKGVQKELLQPRNVNDQTKKTITLLQTFCSGLPLPRKQPTTFRRTREQLPTSIRRTCHPIATRQLQLPSNQSSSHLRTRGRSRPETLLPRQPFLLLSELPCLPEFQ